MLDCRVQIKTLVRIAIQLTMCQGQSQSLKHKTGQAVGMRYVFLQLDIIGNNLQQWLATR